MKRSLLIIFVMMILLVGQAQLQRKLAHFRPLEAESLLYLPSGEYLKPLVLGFDQMAADLLWIKTIGYFGGHFMTDKEYPWLYHILTLIIDLDPRFDFPYYFGGIILSLEASQVDKANQILERGIEAYPEKWEYPFYIGFNYFYHQKDAAKAVPYIEKASSLPESPAYLKSLTGSLYAKTNKNEAAVRFYREAYRNATDDLIKQNIQEKINRILSGIDDYDTGNSDKTSD
ncbi:MAG: tetratricopeptide repeat protein [Nitrospiria bacterium]